MGQQEVLEYLIKNKKPTGIVEMQKHLNITRANVSRACRVLEKEKAIIVKHIKCGCYIKHIIQINPKYLKR